MSAPDTNIEKQQKRHYGPLLGILAALILVAIGVFAIPAITDEASEEASTIPATDQSLVTQ